MLIVFRYFLISLVLVSCGLTASLDNLNQDSKNDIPSTSPEAAQPIILNPVINVQMDVAHNILTQNPKLTFEYSETGNTYSISQFEYSIGTAILSQDTIAWTSIGSVKEIQNTLLSLLIDRDYYINIRVRDSKDNLSSVVSRSWRTVGTVGVSARFASAPEWNDYVRKSATSTVCDGTEFNYYSCLHGGEKKTLTVTGENSCTGLTAKDTFDAFYWECVAGSPVSFVSKELNHGKGLRDLLDTTEWKDIRVIVFKNSIPISASTPAKWWTTPVLPLPDNSLGAVVDLNANTIYTLSESRSTPGYRLNLNTSIIMKDGAELSTSAATLFLPYEFLAGQFRYYRNWFEGDFKGAGDIYEDNRQSYFNVFNNVKSKINIRTGDFWFRIGLMRNYTSDPSVDENYALANSIVRDSVFHGKMFPSNTTANNSVVMNTIQFQYFGVMNSANNFHINTSKFSPAGYLVWNDRTTFHNILAKSSNMFFSGNDYFTISNLVTEEFTLGIMNSTALKFTGNFVYNTKNCSAASSTGVNVDCTLAAPSNATVKTGYEIMSQAVHPFLGVVSTDTKQSIVNNNPVPFLMISDFINFDQPTRRWVDSTNYYAACATGMTCVIFDYALKATDTLVLNKSGDLTNPNSVFPLIETDPCPSEVHGNKALTNQHTVVNTYLQHAFEIIGDEIGNDNGLCESSESCIYSPNPGAYQGHGDYRSKTCAFQNGTISNVKMYAYPNNGY